MIVRAAGARDLWQARDPSLRALFMLAPLGRFTNPKSQQHLLNSHHSHTRKLTRRLHTTDFATLNYVSRSVTGNTRTHQAGHMCATPRAIDRIANALQPAHTNTRMYPFCASKLDHRATYSPHFSWKCMHAYAWRRLQGMRSACISATRPKLRMHGRCGELNVRECV